MNSIRSWKPSPSMVVASIALFVALAGGAYAAGLKKNSVGSKQLKDGGVAGIDVKDDSLTGADVNEATLSLPAGLQGATGPQGPQGSQGPAGSADTAAQILAKLITVDGSGSALDTDQLDGQSASDFLGSTAAAGGDLDGNYPNPTIGANAIDSAQITSGGVGVSEIQNVEILEAEGLGGVNDAVGGGATDSTLIDNVGFGYKLLGRCTENPAGTFQAQVLLETQGLAKTSAIDTTGPGGVNDMTGIADGAGTQLLSVGPATGSHISTGSFVWMPFRIATSVPGTSTTGNVSAATNVGGSDCRFSVALMN